MRDLDAPTKRPAFITVFAVFFGFAAVMYFGGMVHALVADGSSYIQLGNERVQIGEVRSTVFVGSLIASAFCFAIALSFWDAKPWGRHVFMAFCFGGLFVGGVLTNTLADYAPLLLPLVLAVWYLYFKKNVIGYFGASNSID